jgi:hypothetical protein
MIISLRGKIGSGKDLVGMIIQVLTDKPTAFDGMEDITEEDVKYRVWDAPTFINKKFADSLKDMVCLLLGCTREELEERKFKETELGEEWWYYKLGDGVILPRGYYPNESDNQMCEERYLVKPTPRLFLQLLGTEAGRKIIHPNIWVNALMSKYKTLGFGDEMASVLEFPNWVITDMRFPNELKAVKDRGGLTISIERDRPCMGTTPFDGTEEEWNMLVEYNKRENAKHAHESETALDNAKFDYTIGNNGSIKDLITVIKGILLAENII